MPRCARRRAAAMSCASAASSSAMIAQPRSGGTSAEHLDRGIILISSRRACAGVMGRAFARRPASAHALSTANPLRSSPHRGDAPPPAARALSGRRGAPRRASAASARGRTRRGRRRRCRSARYGAKNHGAAQVPRRRDDHDAAHVAEREHERERARGVLGRVATRDLEQGGRRVLVPGALHLLGLGEPAGRRVAGQDRGAERPAAGQAAGVPQPRAGLERDAVLGADPGLAMPEDDQHPVAGVLEPRRQQARRGAVGDHGQPRVVAQQRGRALRPRRRLEHRRAAPAPSPRRWRSRSARAPGTAFRARRSARAPRRAP